MASERLFLVALLLLVPYALYGAAGLQAYAVMDVWADTAVHRTILGWEVPVTWIGFADGLLTILGVVVANRVSIALGKRGREPGDFAKMAIGYLGVGLAFLFAAGIATMAIVPVVLWIAFYAIMDLAVGCSEPAVQSLISRDAPPSVNALTMAVLKATTTLSYFAVGWTGRFHEPLGPSLFWMATGAQSLVALVLIGAGRSWLRRLLEPDRDDIAVRA